MVQSLKDGLSIGFFALLLLVLFFASSNETRVSVVSGPYILPPHEHHSNAGETVIHHGVHVRSMPVVVEKDTWANAIEVGIKNAPHATLHHVSLYEKDEPNPDCPAEDKMLASFGSETPKIIRFPSTFGVYLKKGSVLYLEGMLHNPSPPQGPGGTYQDVRILITLHTKEKGAPLTPLQFRHVSLVDEPDCIRIRPADTFTVPPHSRFVRVSDVMRSEPNEERVLFAAPGKIVSIGAHLHPWEGGKKIEVFVNGHPIAGFPIHKTGTNPWEWTTPYIQNLGFQVSPGDELTIAAYYTNESDVPRPGAMGMIGFYVAED